MRLFRRTPIDGRQRFGARVCAEPTISTRSPPGGTFRTCLISELSLRSGVKRKLDLETPKGGFWREAAVRAQTALRDCRELRAY